MDRLLQIRRHTQLFTDTIPCFLQPQEMLNFKPWSENLGQLRDDHWKHIRSQLSPAFSSGKLKKVINGISARTSTISSANF